MLVDEFFLELRTYCGRALCKKGAVYAVTDFTETPKRNIFNKICQAKGDKIISRKGNSPNW